MLALFLIEPGKFVETGDFAGNLHLDSRWVESRDSPHTALARKNGSGKSLIADPIRADYAHPGNDTTSFHSLFTAEILYLHCPKICGNSCQAPVTTHFPRSLSF